MRRAALGVTTLLLAGCVPASPDADTYDDKAAQTLGSAVSDVRTVQRLLETLDDDRMLRPAAVAQLRYSEDGLDTATTAFTELNPPPQRDRLNTRASTLLGDAGDLLAEARIAVDEAGDDMSNDHSTIDAYLELLDRQILDHDGRMLGKVDDLEIEQREDGRVYVTALLTGPGALGPRLGGALSTFVTSTWSRLSGRTEPARVEWSQVASVGTAVRLAVGRTTVAVDGFESWMRDRVIAAIPGSRVKPE